MAVLNSSAYYIEGLRQLSDTEIYECLQEDPTAEYKNQLEWIIREAVVLGIMKHEVVGKLVHSHPLIQIFYHLPKVCKSKFPMQGRPIVANIGSLGEPLWNLMDNVLQPLVIRLPSYLWDTKHII